MIFVIVYLFYRFTFFIILMKSVSMKSPIQIKLIIIIICIPCYKVTINGMMAKVKLMCWLGLGVTW